MLGLVVTVVAGHSEDGHCTWRFREPAVSISQKLIVCGIPRLNLVNDLLPDIVQLGLRMQPPGMLVNTRRDRVRRIEVPGRVIEDSGKRVRGQVLDRIGTDPDGVCVIGEEIIRWVNG